MMRFVLTLHFGFIVINSTITLPTTMLGGNYDIELEHWQKTHGYRVFSDGKKVLLDGGLGISLSLLFGDIQYETW